MGIDTETDLAARVDAGDIEGTLAILRGLSVEARTTMRTFAREIAARFPSSLDKETYTWEGRPRTPDAEASIHVRRRRAAVCIVIAGGAEADILACVDQTAVFVRAMAELRPACATSLAERLVDKGAFEQHPLARALVAAGVSTRPTTERYVLGFWTRDFQGGLDREWKRGLREALLDDPDHLATDVEELFATEGTSELSMASSDKYAGGAAAEDEARVPLRFSTALVALIREGKLERARMIDLTLATLAREWPAFRSGWFSRFHDDLAPTAEEIAQREATYVALLASTIPATVAMAVEALTKVQASRLGIGMDRRALLGALTPVMTARAKGTALGGIRLLGRALEAEPGLGRQGALVAALALAHSASDVQKAALEMLETHGSKDDAELRAICTERVDLVAASLRKRASAWVAARPGETPGGNAERTESRPAPATLAVETRPHGSATPAIREAIAEIVDPQELVLRLSTVLESGDDVVENERVLDGVARLAGSPQLAAPLATLRKRAMKLQERAVWEKRFRFDLARLVLALLDGKTPARFAPTTVRGRASLLDARDFFADIIDETAAHALAVKRRGLPRLSAPTELPAYVDPVVLARRVLAYEERGVAPGTRDAEVALLRLPPPDERFDEARALARSAKSPIGAALQYALGVSDAPPTDLALRLAASRARDPESDDPRLASDHALGAGAGLVARHTWDMARHQSDKFSFPGVAFRREPPPAPSAVPPSTLVLALHRGQTASTFAQDHELYADLGGDLGGVRSLALLWPRVLDLVFIEGATELTGNLEFGSNHSGHRAYVEPLLWPTTRLNEAALVMLAIALAAKPPDESGLAVEAFACAADQGRLDPVALGAVMAKMRSTGVILLARWAKTLAQAARISAVARVAVMGCLERTLAGTDGAAGEPGEPPKDLAKLLELLFELRSEAPSGPLPGATRAYLEALPDKGKLKALRRALLAG